MQTKDAVNRPIRNSTNAPIMILKSVLGKEKKKALAPLVTNF